MSQYSNFPNGITSMGIPFPSSPVGPSRGRQIHVRPYSGDNSNDGSSPELAVKTLVQAKSLATADRNDTVWLHSESNTGAYTTDYLSANLDWNKDGVHLIGVNDMPFIGQRSRIAPLSTATSFANLFTVSANNCLIANIEIFQGAGSTTLSAAQTALTVSGQRNRIQNCQISGIGDSTLDYAGSNSLTITGSENLFVGDYIGLDTVIRGTSVTEVVISGAARTKFDRCEFDTYTSGSTFKMISVATTCDRWIKFNYCDFNAVQNITSSAAPTGLIGITTMNGQVIVRDPVLTGFANFTTADNSYVRVLGHDGTATGHLLGIAQGVDVA